MARRLETFPGDDDSPRRYPWQDWIDGAVWEIRRGADYDIATENMRVNLHLKADALGRKVRTKKVAEGNGLVFQFLESEEETILAARLNGDRSGTEHALSRLYEDASEIYERARAEVDIERKDGRTQKYAAIRFKRQIDQGYAEGKLTQSVAKMVRKPTLGFGHLKRAGRTDLMLGTLVSDPTRAYHFLFSPTTIESAEARLRKPSDP